MTTIRLISALLTLCAFGAPLAHAAPEPAYPARPIKVMHGFQPGGPPDAVLRLIARQMEPSLGTSVVVENKPGASGTIAAAAVARAAPDGHTLLFGVAANMAVAPAAMKAAPYDPAKDFTPIVEVARGQYVLLARAEGPARDLGGFAAWAKRSAPPLRYASPGIGTVHHLAMEMLKRSLNVPLEHVPHRGGLYEALIRGDVQVMLESMPSPLPHLSVGNVVALAVTGERRLPGLPDVPTLAEQGVRDVDVSSWWGFVGPAGLPAAVVARLNAEITRALSAPEVKAILTKWSIEPSPGTPEAFGAHIAAEADKWKRRVREANVPIE